MSAPRTVTDTWAEMDRTGKSGACALGECGYCTPLEVYVVPRGRPVVGPPAVSIRCACACHKGRPVRRKVITV
ncbi:hypothetical protein [Streptomyces sp. TRM49041]|uniref:hypothetical protein n=1 Tax=Streptomyces sp. TRM49041 TaxID=2603216 RepID=UPI0011EFA48E|nr:hypothetical protein [Streptomyces sp. TRM49041]